MHSHSDILCTAAAALTETGNGAQLQAPHFTLVRLLHLVIPLYDPSPRN